MNITFDDFRKMEALESGLDGYKRYPVMLSQPLSAQGVRPEPHYMQVTAKTVAEAADWVLGACDCPENAVITVVGLNHRFHAVQRDGTWRDWRKRAVSSSW